jgi:hypothetical protein
MRKQRKQSAICTDGGEGPRRILRSSLQRPRLQRNGGSDSVYSFFDVSGFEADFDGRLFTVTDIDIRLVVNSDIQPKNARLSHSNGGRDHRRPLSTCSERPTGNIGKASFRGFTLTEQHTQSYHCQVHQQPTSYTMAPRVRASIWHNSRYPRVGRFQRGLRRNNAAISGAMNINSHRSLVENLQEEVIEPVGSETTQLKNQQVDVLQSALPPIQLEQDSEGQDGEGQDAEEQSADYESEELGELDPQPEVLGDPDPDREPDDDKRPQVEFEIFDRQYQNDDEPAEEAAPDANLPDDPFLVAFTLWCDMFGITRLAYSVFISLCSLVSSILCYSSVSFS